MCIIQVHHLSVLFLAEHLGRSWLLAYLPFFNVCHRPFNESKHMLKRKLISKLYAVIRHLDESSDQLDQRVFDVFNANLVMAFSHFNSRMADLTQEVSDAVEFHEAVSTLHYLRSRIQAIEETVIHAFNKLPDSLVKDHVDVKQTETDNGIDSLANVKRRGKTKSKANCKPARVKKVVFSPRAAEFFSNIEEQVIDPKTQKLLTQKVVKNIKACKAAKTFRRNKTA